VDQHFAANDERFDGIAVAHRRLRDERWRRNGLVRTVLLMWRLRLAFFFGSDPAQLARRYGDGGKTKPIAVGSAPAP